MVSVKVASPAAGLALVGFIVASACGSTDRDYKSGSKGGAAGDTAISGTNAGRGGSGGSSFGGSSFGGSGAVRPTAGTGNGGQKSTEGDGAAGTGDTFASGGNEPVGGTGGAPALPLACSVGAKQCDGSQPQE